MATPSVQVNVRLDPALYAAVKREAARSKVTVTSIVAAAVENHVHLRHLQTEGSTTK